MNGILRKKIWLVHVDGKEIGVFTNGRLVNYIQGLGYNGYELLDIFIHHLKNIEIADLETVLDYTSVPIYFYIHDYFTVCPFNGLVDSDGRYCGCGFPNKKKCLTCNYFSELEIKRVAEIKKLFAHFENRLQFVAPSDNAKDNWNQDYPQYKNKVRVIYHQTFEGIYSGNSKTVEIGEPIRIAFVGYQIKHKGWDEWKKAVTANSGNTKYEFFQFGWGEDHLDNCKQISVDFKENLNAMTYALNAILIPKLGAVGAAVATVLAESIVAIIQICFAWNEMREAFAKIQYFKLILINTVIGVFLFFARVELLTVQPIVSLILTCFAFFALYGCMLLLFKDSLVEEYALPIIRKVIRKQ